MTVNEFLEVFSGMYAEVKDSRSSIAKTNTENLKKYFGDYKITKIQNMEHIIITIADYSSAFLIFSLLVYTPTSNFLKKILAIYTPVCYNIITGKRYFPKNKKCK